MEKQINHYCVQEVNGCLMISNPLSAIVLYRIPYKMLVDKTYPFEIKNRFINYVLLSARKGLVYVGKSKNGLDNRPTAHTDKCECWDWCFVITMKTDDFLNDGIIQYIENELNAWASSLKNYTNVTCMTSKSTANSKEQVICEEYLAVAKALMTIVDPTLEIEEENQEAIIEEDELPTNLERPTVESVQEIFSEVNRDFRFVPRATLTSCILDGKTISSIYEKRNFVDVYLRAKEEDLENIGGNLLPVQNSEHRVGNWKLRISSEEDFQYLRQYINQCINL